MDEELFYRLALLNVVGIGSITAKRLIEYFGSAKAVFVASPKEILHVNKIGETLLKNLSNAVPLQLAEVQLAHIRTNNINVISYEDSNYPYLLGQCEDAPLFLFSTGLFDFSDRKIISIIGTRNPSGRGVAFCEKLIDDLREFNPVIVSGLAYGVDVCAHNAALNCGLDTCAVLGHGLERIYPEKHMAIANKIKDNGALLTEFNWDSKIDRENFIQRNRIVAGMSQATIVIESAIKGGSMSTVRFANDYNRDVFAVPGRVTDIMSQGCNEIIRSNRGQLLCSATDIIEALNWNHKERKAKSIQPQLFLDLSNEEQKVYDYLKEQGKEVIDFIALASELPIYKVSSILLELELKGLVRPLPGKYFELY
ncbi:DNA-processing protein DprA [Myroides injenensis]|uniref:DNA-processing protein DprA n=3 Tax=Myroides injenensis TaxID=1183151 RepID=UPI000289E58C|nr:DNA-processing protein DprA [Myroides injenensis]